MPVQFTILGSGSGGNSAYLETAQTRLLIDAGFSARQIRRRLEGLGRSPETLDALLITHEHMDHTRALGVLCPRLQIPIYANRFTREAIAGQVDSDLPCRVFATGSTFEIGDIVVESFTVPHDAQDPVGFLLHTPAGNIGYVTDLGHVTRLVLERLRSARVLILEANHDVVLLQNDLRRPWSTKQRILSRHGHLSNETAAEAAAQIASADLQHLYLAHLSRDCNRPELAFRVIQEKLAGIGATHIHIEVTCQDSPTPTLTLEDRP